jgi:hypothetical protein
MIELTTYQLTFFTSIVLGIVWLIRLEGRVNTERELRLQADVHHKESNQQMNGRILDEFRKVETALVRFETKLDSKQDKHVKE